MRQFAFHLWRRCSPLLIFVKIPNPLFFDTSLQRKEMQKVHQRFRGFAAPHNKKSGSAAAG